jgi:hypothetical protein
MTIFIEALDFAIVSMTLSSDSELCFASTSLDVSVSTARKIVRAIDLRAVPGKEEKAEDFVTETRPETHAIGT